MDLLSHLAGNRCALRLHLIRNGVSLFDVSVKSLILRATAFDCAGKIAEVMVPRRRLDCRSRLITRALDAERTRSISIWSIFRQVLTRRNQFLN